MNAPDGPRVNEWVLPPDEPAETITTPRPPAAWHRFSRIGTPLASVVAAFIVGAAAVYGYQQLHGSTEQASSASAAAQVGQSPFRDNRYGPGGGLRGGGGVSGEQYVEGTIAGKTSSSVTVKSPTGSATYTVNSETEIVRNGQATTLADVKVGDGVFLHVYPSSSGGMRVERLFAGTVPAPSRSDDNGGQTFGPTT